MDSCDKDLFCELVGYVSREPCTCGLARPGGRPCLSCRARENYEAHKKHLREAEAAQDKLRTTQAELESLQAQVKYFSLPKDYEVKPILTGERLLEHGKAAPDDFSGRYFEQYHAIMERMLTEIGPERISHVLYPPPPNPSMKRQIVGHDGESLGEVWIEWPDPYLDRREITIKGRYLAGAKR